MLPIKYEAITKSYDIYFKVEDDGELLFEEPGSGDLDTTIKRCNELNDSYPYDGGIFVVCSVNGNKYSDLAIEYEPK